MSRCDSEIFVRTVALVSVVRTDYTSIKVMRKAGLSGCPSMWKVSASVTKRSLEYWVTDLRRH